MSFRQLTLQTRLGHLELCATDRGLSSIQWVQQKLNTKISVHSSRVVSELLASAARQLTEYLLSLIHI